MGTVFTDHEVIHKDPANPLPSPGPLVGILGALERSESRWLVVAPGDTPALENNWSAPLLENPRSDGAVVFDGKRQQHLHLLLATNLAANLREYLVAGQHRVWHWLATLSIEQIKSTNSRAFRNFNTPADMEG